MYMVSQIPVLSHARRRDKAKWWQPVDGTPTRSRAASLCRRQARVNRDRGQCTARLVQCLAASASASAEVKPTVMARLRWGDEWDGRWNGHATPLLLLAYAVFIPCYCIYVYITCDDCLLFLSSISFTTFPSDEREFSEPLPSDNSTDRALLLQWRS